MKDRIAKFIRVVTVPPVLVAAMLLIFRFVYRDKFISVPLLIIELVLLVVVPAAAYPVSGRKKGDGKDLRERQRKLAFIMNLFGYTFALVMGIIMKCSPMLRVILWGYFWSIIVLTILNKVCKVRASGHACSCTMPYLLFGYFLGLRAVPVCVALYLAEFWASVRLKRHTVKEFMLGSGTAAGVFAVLLIVRVAFGNL